MESDHVTPNLNLFQVAMLSHVATSYLNAGFETGRYGTAHYSIVPYQVRI